MIREALVEYCAPTLAGIKTGSICTIQNGSKDIDDEIRELNGCLVKKGLSLIPLKKTAKTTIVYLYRPDRLKRDLQVPEAQKILEEKGYPCRNAGCCIVALVKRLMMDKDFPHEIGLFLGYPPSDVESFMKSPWEGVKSAVAFGCLAMGAEVLEEGEYEPMFAALEGSLSGKKIALFGSYGWGDGQWMRDWEDRARAAGANIVTDSVTANNAPDDAALDACKSLGRALA